MVLPEFLDASSWNEWVEHRKQLKRPMTDHAKRLALNKLIALHSQGEDPKAVIEQAILNGWQGLFPVKGDCRNGYRNGLYETGGIDRGRRLSAVELVQQANRIKYPGDPYFDPEGYASTHATTIEGTSGVD